MASLQDSPSRKLPDSFYQRPDVLTISRELLGKVLVTQVNGVRTSARIVETEAYRHEGDAACHAHLGRRTARTEIMYASGGVSYVYLCYGIHRLFNIITNDTDVPDAVLIRAAEPLEGLDVMLERRKLTKVEPRLTAGPGCVSQALGIQLNHYGLSLQSDTLWLEDDGTKYSETQIIRSPRVGIDYAGKDALLPWRFRVKGSRWTSRPH